MTKTKPRNEKAAKPAPKGEDVFKAPSTSLLIALDESKTAHRQFADVSLSPVTLGAVTARAWAQKSMGEIGINEAVAVVRERADAAASGDLDAAKAMLIAQATALDAIFNEMARKAAALLKIQQDGTWSFSGETMETVTRIAFKAQNQCRGTLQTLGELVNPRSVAFIRQANMANGPQQVNNGVLSGHKGDQALAASTPAREIQNQSNELKGLTDERMDTGTAGEAGGASQWLATVDAINRAKVGRGQGEGVPEQPEAR